MTVSLPWPLLAGDLLDCMGWGLVLALAYDLCRTLTGSGFWRCFFLDLLGFLAAAVVLRGYAAGLSAAGAPRWYHGAGLALGAAAWFAGIAPALAGVRRRLAWLLARPVRLAEIWLWQPLEARVRARLARPRKIKKKKSPKLPEKQLPKKGRMLYNSK